jgi:DNA polymerase-3 subunit alpha
VEVAPGQFDDLIALMALIRPGPMAMAPEYISRKHGRTPIEYVHPDVEPILRETYGVALYQEQVIRIANVLAGFSMAEGDGLRKAMGKKLPEEMTKYKDRFVSGCGERGIEKRLAAEIFAMIERFAGYGFPKAHSAAYAVIAAQTAYLKANHPVEFMAALLSSELGNTDRIVSLMAECRRAGIGVLPPNINCSAVEFSVERTESATSAVRFGLAAVKNVGVSAVRAILESRCAEPSGRFSSLGALCEAVDWSVVNRRAMESLTKAGALDELGDRGGVLAALDAAIAAAQKRQRATARGQMDLFGTAPDDGALPPIPPSTVTPREVLEWEKELLGTYMSDHPLAEILNAAIRTEVGRSLSEIAHLESRSLGSTVRVLAMVAGVRRIVTKSERSMAVAILEDLTGRVDLVLFPDAFERHGDSLHDGVILDVRGRLERRGEALQIVCETLSIDLPCAGPDSYDPETIVIRFRRGADSWAEIKAMQQVDDILKRHEGDNPVIVEIPAPGRSCRMISRTRRSEWSVALERELQAVTGVLTAELVPAVPDRLAS